MGKQELLLAAQLIPIATELMAKLINTVTAAKADGYDVPSIEKLKAQLQRLEDLEDL